MALNLNSRQRTMLKDMGVRVWLPQPPFAPSNALPLADTAAQNAMVLIAESAVNKRARADFSFKNASSADIHRSPAAAPIASPPTAPWQWGKSYTLYTSSQAPAAPAWRWLVLAEMPLGALQNEAFDPLAGEAGKLLDQMLRAAKFDRATHTTFVPWVRLANVVASPQDTAATPDLADIFHRTRPHAVLLMGRLAAQAVLASDLPLAKLRGQLHHLPGESAPVPTLVTYDAAYLLRNGADKAKAWGDLCLAMALAANP